MVAALFIILLFGMAHTDVPRLLPILGTGPSALLNSSLTNISLFSEILLFGLIAPLIANQAKLFGVGFYSIIIAILINIALTIVMILVFNYIASARLIFPAFQLARLITLEKFIQRVEAVFVFLWFFTAAIQLSALFYGTVISFAQAFRIGDYRPLSIPLGVLVFTISLIPTSMTQAVNLNDFQISKYYSIVVFGVPLLLWLVSLMIHKKSSEQNNE
ncbi:MAG TPA: hypothetical protein DDW50_15875 [Firmicutes bacterium]|nr:hypothetical protein [Bacillota bacterium]